MKKNVDVVIIGAGTAGLSAVKEVKKHTSNFIVIQDGPMGTTCARVGCMPSKVLIQVAEDYARRTWLQQIGILNSEALKIDLPSVLAHVRKLRDYFVSHVIESLKSLDDHIFLGRATFESPTTLSVDTTRIETKQTIIATGSRPIIPGPWTYFGDSILTSDSLFEQTKLPNKIGIVGLGVIGIELGQALSRLGLEAVGFGHNEFVGGLSDPAINEKAVSILNLDFKTHHGHFAKVEHQNTGLKIEAGQTFHTTDKILACIGRSPNLETLNLQHLGISSQETLVPPFDPHTMKINNFPIFIAGDAAGYRPILHESADEGRIAGFNACHPEVTRFRRRCPLTITFSDPPIAVVGTPHRNLNLETAIIGFSSFDDQGRSRLKGKNKGMMHIYGNATDGKILGAEFIAPEGDHLAHLLAWTIQQNLTVFDILKHPFYHPTIEEGLRTCLRHLASQVKNQPKASSEMTLCDSTCPDALS